MINYTYKSAKENDEEMLKRLEPFFKYAPTVEMSLKDFQRYDCDEKESIGITTTHHYFLTYRESGHNGDYYDHKIIKVSRG